MNNLERFFKKERKIEEQRKRTKQRNRTRLYSEMEMIVKRLYFFVTRGQFRGRLLIFSARSFKVLGIRY